MKKKLFPILGILAFLVGITLALTIGAEAEAAEKTIIGSPDDPSLTINKFEGNGNTTFPGTGDSEQIIPEGYEKPVPGVTFKIVQTHSFAPEDNEWLEITGEKPTYEIKTNSDGQIHIPDISLGRYTVQEVDKPDGPKHINLNPTEYSVDIPMTSQDGSTLNYDVVINPKNETIKGAVVLTLTETGTEKALEDASFKLYDSDGNEITDIDEENSFLKTDEEGRIIVNGLNYGKYYFQEVNAAEGYLLDDAYKEFSINKTGSVIAEEHSGDVVKVSHMNDSIPKITMSILHDDANDSEDYLGILRKKAYKYRVKAEIPKSIQSYEKYQVTVNLDDRLSIPSDLSEVRAYSDEALENELDVFYTTKSYVDSQLVMELSEWPGEEIYFGFEASINPEALIDKDTEPNGIPVSAVLNFNNGRGAFTEGEERTYSPSKSRPVYVNPLEGGFKLTKIDGKTGNELQGAIFELQTSDGNTLELVKDSTQSLRTAIRVNGEVITTSDELSELTTGGKGTVLVEGLDPGEYQLVEVKAPVYQKTGDDPTTDSIEDDNHVYTASYRLLTKPVKITVADSNTKEFQVKNYKLGWLLPQTGGIGTSLFSLGGMLLIAGSVLLYRKEKKKQV